MGIGAGRRLIDQVADDSGMFLRCAEHQRLVALVDHVEEGFDPIGFPFADVD